MLEFIGSCTMFNRVNTETVKLCPNNTKIIFERDNARFHCERQTIVGKKYDGAICANFTAKVILYLRKNTADNIIA